ncbi:MAG TPA: hypothetical protein VKD70_18970 [Candidatus Acidoferrum sp.]|nr:hypothetical protein [Candidatus Acidoferrum sp.]
MTRCLDCGAERQADQCPACGLTSAAAELVFRKRLIYRTLIFLAGSLCFPYVSQVFPPLDLDLMLVFFGVLFFIGLTLAVILERLARKHAEIEVLKRVFSGFVPLPWILTIILFVNGKFDTPKNIEYIPATVRDTFYMKGIIRGSRRLVVGSWRPGRKLERIAVEADDYDRFHVGDSLEVAIEPGVAGIPWVYGVYRKGPARP